MEYVLSQKILGQLRMFLRPDTLLALDFDGTLAPIENDPSMVKISRSTSELLVELNSKLPIAIISGRDASIVRGFLPMTPKYLIGNHGHEDSSFPENMTNAGIIEGVHKTLLERFRPEIIAHRIFVEAKTYSLALHFRQSPDPEAADAFLSRALKDLPSVRILKGKMVYDLLPQSEITKGTAFINLLKKEKSSGGIYIGDDRTDEDVFFHRGPEVFAIRIGETTDSFAPFYLKCQNEIDAFFVEILKTLRVTHAPE